MLPCGGDAFTHPPAAFMLALQRPRALFHRYGARHCQKVATMHAENKEVTGGRWAPGRERPPPATT